MLKSSGFRNRLVSASQRLSSLSSKSLEHISQIQFNHGVINERLREEIWAGIIDPSLELPDQKSTSLFLNAYRRSYLDGNIPASAILADLEGLDHERRVALHNSSFMNLIHDPRRAKTLSEDAKLYIKLLRECQGAASPLLEVEFVLWELYHESNQLAIAAAQKLLNFNLEEANQLRLMFGKLLIEKSAEYDDIQGSHAIMRDLKLPKNFDRFLIPSFYRVGNQKEQFLLEEKLKGLERGGRVSTERKNTYLSLLVNAVDRFDANEINRILRKIDAEKWSLRPRDIVTLYRSLHNEGKFDVSQHLRILENFMRHSTPFQLIKNHEAISKTNKYEESSPMLLKLSKDVLEQSPEELPSLLSFIATRQAIKTDSTNPKRVHWERIKAFEKRFVDYSLRLYRQNDADPIFLGSVFFAQFEEKFKADRLNNFEKLFLECSDDDREELLAVFAENISLGFPHSEEITRKSLAGFSEKFVDFILRAKTTSTTQHEAGDELFININELLLTDSTSISAQYSQEIAASYVNWSLKQRGSNSFASLNLLLRKMDINGDRDLAIRLIKDLLLAAWEAMDNETFQRKQFHNIFNHIVYYPKDYSSYLEKQNKFKDVISSLENHQYVDFPTQSEKNKFVDLPTEMRELLILEPLGQLFGYLDDSLQLIKNDPDEVEVSELASMVTLIATQPHIRFQDIAKMSKPEYLVGLPSEFIVDLVNVLSKADSAEPLLDLFDKNVEILKVCSDQTKLFERLPGIYEKVLKSSKSEDVIFEFHEKVKNYVADASFDFQPKLSQIEVINTAEKVPSARCFRGRHIRNLESLPDLALYSSLARFPGLSTSAVNIFPDSRIPMLKERLTITLMNRCETGAEIMKKLEDVGLDLPLDITNIRALLADLINSQDRLFSKKIMGKLLAEVMNNLNLNANTELFIAACCSGRLDMAEQFGARLTQENVHQFSEFLAKSYNWESNRLGATLSPARAKIDLSSIPVDQNVTLIKNLIRGASKIENHEVRSSFVDAIMEKYIFYLRGNFESVKNNSFVTFLKDVKEFCGDIGDTRWLYFYNNYSRIDHILDRASKNLMNGTTTIPKLFKETFTKEEFPPGFTKSMRNSIYQDLKYNSNGEAFYSHDNFEKDFLELIRLEKNLTGRDFDLSQRQFSELKNVLEEDDKIVLRRLSKECSARFGEKLKEIEVDNEKRAAAI